jgi:hypothetical protein
MLDEYQIRLKEKNREFAATKSAIEKRGIELRRNEDSRRTSINDRRKESLPVENDRRKEERRVAERRKLEDRRVTSDYSQERLEEERDRLQNRNSHEAGTIFFSATLVLVLAIILYLFFIEEL